MNGCFYGGVVYETFVWYFWIEQMVLPELPAVPAVIESGNDWINVAMLGSMEDR